MKMLRLIITIVLLLLPVSSSACWLCFVMDPTVYVDVKLNIQNDTLTKVSVTWEFSEVYTQHSIILYDENRDGKLSDTEFSTLQQSYLAELKKHNLHTEFGQDELPVPLQSSLFTNTHFELAGKQLIFIYDITPNTPLGEQAYVKMLIHDKAKFFKFLPREDKTQVVTDGNWLLSEDSDFFAEVPTFHLIRDETTVSVMNPMSLYDDKQQLETAPNVLLLLATQLNRFLLKIQSLLQQTESGMGLFAWLSLFFFSLLYGVIHALGPGHGKSLMGLYFLSGEKKIQQAWKLAGSIGIIHVFSAFLLTLIAYLIAQVAANELSGDSQKIANAISGGVIVIVALYLFVNKLRHLGHHSCSCCSGHNHHKTDFGIAVAAGAVPCPGTVLVFMAVFTVGSYGSGILSAIAMSLGMSLVVGLSGSFSVGLRHLLKDKLTGLLNSSEYLAILIMLILGGALVYGSLFIS